MADELQVFNEPSLAHRYAVGSNDISWYVPGTTQHSFFIGMPQNVSDLSRLNRKVVQNLRDTHQQLRQAHSENIMVLNEIGNQISQLESSSAQGFSEMAAVKTPIPLEPFCPYTSMVPGRP